ncbi:hypothetical protein TNCV_1393911 [Trichonephila clavipes]|nr:hypothetical protein TNCV_1393911 [Trichonephila clavipes]
MLANLEYPCILGVDFISGSKIVLDFDRKPLAIPADEGNLDIDLTKNRIRRQKNNGLPLDNPEAYRFAVDYKKLNAITKYPRYPLPLIEDLQTEIPHTAIMSSLDIHSGYFQLAVITSDVV